MGQTVVNTMNRMLSANIMMQLDTRQTDLNDNILVIGGSGCGKSFKFAKPNILQMSSSFIITDPKGELCRDTAGFLEAYGYEIKVINLLDFKKSSRYNPFVYLKLDKDVMILIQNLIRNTTPKGASASDPFWEKAEAMLLQSLFFYAWKEGMLNEETGKVEHNIGVVLKLLRLAEFEEDENGNKMPSELDDIMDELAEREPNHPAVVNYNSVMRGAADTVRSIIISANSRLQYIQSPEIIDFMSEDEMDIPSIGEKKTAVFCIIPDVDKTYNFLAGLFYTQAFQQLYYTADFIHDGRLPVHVTFLLDEFANVALPDDYTSLLSTMRSREISSIIIIQNYAQLKKLFKDDYETIIGNCDTMIFLGGNEPGTHKELSEMIGKQTIYKTSHGETLGKNGSSSKNEDSLGRELMLPSEIRKLKRSECIVLINGFDAVKDKKIETWKHPLYKEMVRYGGYQYDARIKRAIIKSKKTGDVEAISLSDVQRYEHIDTVTNQEYQTQMKIYNLTKDEKDKPDKPEYKVCNIDWLELMNLDIDALDEDTELSMDDIISADEIRNNFRKALEEAESVEEQNRANHIDVKSEISSRQELELMLYLSKNGYDVPKQRLLISLMHTSQLDTDTILDYFSPDMPYEDMQSYTEMLSSFTE